MMDHPFPHLAQKLLNEPHLITEEKAGIVVAALADRLGITAIVHANGNIVFGAEEMRAEIAGPNAARGREVGYEVNEGVAVIPVQGLLVNRLGCVRPYSGMTGYDGIRQNLIGALSDPTVRAIALDIDSGGGDAHGCIDLADTIHAARAIKPIWAIIDGQSCSAGYALACATRRITLPRTGLTGSIGCVFMHADFSRAIKESGITITFLKYGAAKLDGHSELPLADDAKRRIQARIDFLGDLFVNTVARNRSLSFKDVRGTEAAVLGSEDALKLGLIDAVAAPDEAFRALLKTLN